MLGGLFATLAFLSAVLGWIAWLGIGLAPVVVAAGIVWFYPPLRSLAIHIAAAWLITFIAFTAGDLNGAHRIQTKWNAAEQRAVERGTDVREQAEREIPPVADDPAPRACEPAAAPAPVPAPAPRFWRRRVQPSADPYDRDNR